MRDSQATTNVVDLSPSIKPRRKVYLEVSVFHDDTFGCKIVGKQNATQQRQLADGLRCIAAKLEEASS